MMLMIIFFVSTLRDFAFQSSSPSSIFIVHTTSPHHSQIVRIGGLGADLPNHPEAFDQYTASIYRAKIRMLQLVQYDMLLVCAACYAWLLAVWMRWWLIDRLLAVVYVMAF